MLQRAVILLAHGVELEQRVKEHKLYACYIIHLFLSNNILQIIVHRLEGDGVAVGTRITQDGVILAYHHKVDTPGIDTDAHDIQSAACHLFQALDNLEIQGVDIPVVMTALHNQVIGKAGHLFQFEFVIVDTADDGSTAGSTKVYRKKVFLIIHISYVVVVLSKRGSWQRPMACRRW